VTVVRDCSVVDDTSVITDTAVTVVSIRDAWVVVVVIVVEMTKVSGEVAALLQAELKLLSG
jgi:hypothetical protein